MSPYLKNKMDLAKMLRIRKEIINFLVTRRCPGKRWVSSFSLYEQRKFYQKIYLAII